MENMDMEAIKKEAVPLTKSEPTLGEDDDIVDDGDSGDSGADYTGKGAIVEKKGPEDKPKYFGPGLTEDSMDSVKNRLKEFDAQIEEAKKNPEKARRRFIPEGIQVPANLIPKVDAEKKKLEEDAKKRKLKEVPTVVDEDEVTVLIDKIGMGQLKFTDEEKKRIEVSKKIKLVEVSDEKLHTIKIKKRDKSKKKFESRSYNRAYSPLIALASFYTAKMDNVSSLESMTIIQRPQDNTVKNLLEKWSLFYNKIQDCSVGDFKDFDDFISHTAYTDYNNFIYTILCNSYPEKDKVSFTCRQPNCRQDFDVEYVNREILRQDDVSPEQMAVLAELIDRSDYESKDDNRTYMEENSLISKITRTRIDDTSAILVDFYVPSVKEQVEDIIPRVTDDMNTDSLREMVALAHNIKAIYDPLNLDEAESFDDIEYEEISEFEDIVEYLKTINDDQLEKIGKVIQKTLQPYIFSFGLKDVRCPKCGHSYGPYSMNLDGLLFQRVQRRRQTRYE